MLQSNNNHQCPCCGGTAFYAFSAKDWNQQTSGENFKYFICNVCQLTFIERIPPNIDRFYIHEQYNIPRELSEILPRSQAQVWKVALLKTLIAGGSLLEVGPATGEFAYAAREAGFLIKLVELDHDCCTFLRETLILDVTETGKPIEFLANRKSFGADKTFDAICIWQAIEHIPEFWVLLNNAVDCLANDGVLVVSTPNPLSYQARVLGRYWPHIDAPRHLYLIPQDWFISFAERNGLSVVLNTTQDVGSIGLNYYGWYLAVHNFAHGIMPERLVQRIARAITRVVRHKEGAEGLGCSYTVAFRRSG
jgi:2-polyprenyl-3-methyl-5-hydroxy-6-metoxy-1,4-benzoquinol methylase